MATVYLKKVASSSRSEWVSGTSYVVGDRVWIEDTSMVISFTNTYGDQNNNAIRTYVCIQDTSSTNSPLINSTDWTEAGTKEYPYHSVDGNLTNNTISPESYLESQADRAHTSSNWGSLFHHLRRGESGYSLGKLIFLADEENPLFTITTRATFNQFEVEPDPSIKRIRIILVNGNIGSNAPHNDLDSTFGRVNKCDFYFSGNVPVNNIIGGIYDNLNKLEFNQCYFGPGSKIGYSDPSNTTLDIGSRNFIGLDKCTIDFPNHDANYISYDGQKHSVGVRPYIKNSTIRFKRFKSNQLVKNSYIDIRDSIAYVDSLENDAVTYTNNPTYIQNIAENFIIYVKDESTYTLDENAGSGNFTGTVTKIDPQFIDDSGDYRLRPSSPLIGGLKEDNTQKASLEREYPEGKWFDSHAADGGDGSWETPYNSYADAIDSFTGDEAVVLIKEGQHSLHAGYWSRTYTGGNSAWNPSHDLPKVYPNGIKFIGMGSGSIFDTSGDGISNYGAFWSYDNVNPNSAATPFVFKDFDILMNNSAFINRGMICARRAEYINVNVTQAPNLGASNSQLFDYTTASGPNNTSGEYLKMSGCTVNVSLSRNSSNTAFLVGSNGGLKQYSSCTFADLNRTTSMVSTPPTQFIHTGFGAYPGSYIKDCVIYANNNATSMFGNQSSSDNLDVKNVVVYNAHIAITDDPSVSVSPNWSDNVTVVNPKFIATDPHDFDFRLRADSSLIGGIKSDPTNVYYLQPGNPYNGDGSQKDASAMTADGDPGPFNEFKEIVAAGVPYGSTIVILNGTYDWTLSFGRAPSTNVAANTWQAYTCAGYNYVAETMHGVIFDAKHDPSNVFVYKPYGGTAGAGVFLDLDTTFTGVQFNNMIGADNATRNQISSVSGSAGLGSCTFKNCKFLGHINTAPNSSYPWTGGGRSQYSSTMHWESCEISIAFDHAGGLLHGGDGFADDIYHGSWSWKNCTFYIPTGITTFHGRNAANGTYASPSIIFGINYNQTQRIFKNNIIHIPNGSASIGVNGSNKLPNIENNCLNGVSPVYSSADHSTILDEKNNLFAVNPLFIDPSNNNFSLRPLSPLIGQGK